MRGKRDDQRLSDAHRRAFRLHAWIFAAGAVGLLLIDSLVSAGWWLFWPLLIWGLLLTLHGLFARGMASDEAWADQRATELADKAYDFSHIESIRSRYAGRDAPGRREDEAAKRALSRPLDGDRDQGAR